MGRGLRITAAILAVLVVMMALWASSPWWAARLLAPRLAEHGLVLESLSMTPPGPRRLHVAQLAVRHPRLDATVHLHGITLAYGRVLRGGRLGAVTVDRVVVAMQADGNGDAVPAQALPLAPLLDAPLAAPWPDPGLLAAIPVDGATVDRVELSLNDTAYPPFSLAASGDADGARLHAQVLEPAQPARQATLQADAGAWSAVLGGDGAEPLAVSMRRDGDGVRGRLRGDAAALSAWLAPFGGPRLDADCRLDVALRWSPNPLEALRVDGALSDCRLGPRALQGGRLATTLMRTASGYASVAPAQLALEGVVLPGVRIGTVQLHSGLAVDVESRQLALPRGATLQASAIEAGEVTMTQLAARLAESTTLDADGTAADVVVTLAPAALALGEEDIGFQAARLVLPADGSGLRGEIEAVELAAGEVTLRVPRAVARLVDDTLEATVPVFTVHGLLDELAGSDADLRLALDGVAVSAEVASLRLAMDEVRAGLAGVRVEIEPGATPPTGRFAARLAGVAPFGGRFSLAGDGPARVEIDPASWTFGETLPSASALLEKGWPADLDLVSGTLTWSATLVLGEAVNADARLRLDDVGGVAGGVFFSGASGEGDLSLWPSLATRAAIPLEVAAVDVGVALTAVRGHLALADHGAPVVIANEVSAETLGGRVSVPRYDSRVARVEVVLEDIDLAELAGEERFPGLTMTGRVGGRVPVEIREDGVYITSGRLVNREGGLLRYAAGGAGEGSGVEILFKALETFDYTLLTAEPNYRPDGTLVLAIHLEGTSEEIGRSQPIHFNVNVEQNLLSLLRSVRLVNGLNERVDREVRQYYERNLN